MKTKISTKDRIKVGAALRKIREQLGIRQDFIAKKLKLDSSKLCRMEHGDFGPWSVSLLERWSSALGFDLKRISAIRNANNKKKPAK